jgi:thiol-disulfide isomerase/thioredoxin
MNKPSSAIVLTLLLSSALSLSGLAAVPSFQSAVADYNAGKYTVALNEFKQFEASYPKNGMSHYYLALCYQSLGDRTNARQEYNLTNQYGDATLKGYAQKALAFLGGSGGSGSAGSASTTSGAGGSPTFTPAQLVAAGRANGSIKTAQVSEVMEFYTDWCHVCKEFAPVWSAGQQKVSGVAFHQYNAEDQSNASLVQKYSVHAYPTLVYLDRSGNVLKNMAGAYNTADDFASSIRETH